MNMTITYPYEDGLYINLTNRCDCACTFCIRKSDSKAMFDNDLWLEHEPSREEALADLLSHDLSQYAELVFCGFGEPSYRIDDILWLCDQLHAQCETVPSIRLNTNGHGSLLHGRDITPDLKGRLDVVSISLNASTEDAYCTVTRPKDKGKAWDAMLDFAQKASVYVPNVVMTIVDCGTDPAEINACRTLTERLGVQLRVRTYSES